MRIEENYSLEKHNTFHLPVKARWFMEYTNEEELGRIFRDEYFQECLSLHIGSGSNLLFINDFNISKSESSPIPNASLGHFSVLGQLCNIFIGSHSL